MNLGLACVRQALHTTPPELSVPPSNTDICIDEMKLYVDKLFRWVWYSMGLESQPPRQKNFEFELVCATS